MTVSSGVHIVAILELELKNWSISENGYYYGNLTNSFHANCNDNIFYLHCKHENVVPNLVAKPSRTIDDDN